MRAMPNMRVFVPCDALEARKATHAASHIWGPIYLRFAREKTPVFTTDLTPYTPGKAEVFWDSSGRHGGLSRGSGRSLRPEVGSPSTSSGRLLKPSVLIIGCGGGLYNALLAVKELEKEKIGTIVLNCHTIKPIDEKKIVELAKKTGAVVTVEEHQIYGGLGGAVAGGLAKHFPVPLGFVGVQGNFGGSGSPSELIEKYGLGMKDIKHAVHRVLKRKK